MVDLSTALAGPVVDVEAQKSSSPNPAFGSLQSRKPVRWASLVAEAQLSAGPLVSALQLEPGD